MSAQFRGHWVPQTRKIKVSFYIEREDENCNRITMDSQEPVQCVCVYYERAAAHPAVCIHLINVFPNKGKLVFRDIFDIVWFDLYSQIMHKNLLQGPFHSSAWGSLPPNNVQQSPGGRPKDLPIWKWTSGLSRKIKMKASLRLSLKRYLYLLCFKLPVSFGSLHFTWQCLILTRYLFSLIHWLSVAAARCRSFLSSNIKAP